MKNASTDENLWQKAIVLGQPDIKHGYIFADKRGNNLSRPPSLHHRGAGVRLETSNNDRNNSVGPEQENGATGDSVSHPLYSLVTGSVHESGGYVGEAAPNRRSSRRGFGRTGTSKHSRGAAVPSPWLFARTTCDRERKSCHNKKLIPARHLASNRSQRRSTPAKPFAVVSVKELALKRRENSRPRRIVLRSDLDRAVIQAGHGVAKRVEYDLGHRHLSIISLRRDRPRRRSQHPTSHQTNECWRMSVSFAQLDFGAPP